MTILITLAALAHLASGYAVNAGYFGQMEYLCPGHRTRWDWPNVVVNALIPPGGAFALLLSWYDFGRQPFRWDWPRLLRGDEMNAQDFNGPRSPAHSGEQTGEKQCESIASRKRVAEASETAVSPAISPAASKGREPSRTETDTHKSGDQSGSEPSHSKPLCYACKHRRPLVGDAHSECVHPKITQADRLVSPFLFMQGIRPAAAKRMNVTGHQHGIQKGWFLWPVNFDPTWLGSCDGFEKNHE